MKKRLSFKSMLLENRWYVEDEDETQEMAQPAPARHAPPPEKVVHHEASYYHQEFDDEKNDHHLGKPRLSMNWLKRRHKDEGEEARELVEKAAYRHDVPPEEVVHAMFNEPSEDDKYRHSEDSEYGRERRRSRTGVFVTLTLIGVVFGLAICGFSYLANSADSAGPTADSGINALKQSIAPTAPVNPQLNGTHISFTYPAAFDVVTHPANWTNTSERYSLSSKVDYRKTIQVYVEKVSTLQMDSGYLSRMQHTADYAQTPIKVMGEPAVVMVKSDASERTLYWAHGGSVVIMSATGAGNGMVDWINVIAASLRWIP